MDAWLREAEEALWWMEDLESRICHKNFNFSVTNSARSKVLDLDVKLDRLESLLCNPPPNPSYLDFRWKLFSDIQLRTRTLARSLYALPCPTRPRNVSDAGSIEYNVNNDYNDDQDTIYYFIPQFSKETCPSYGFTLFANLLKSMYSQGQSELAKQPLLSDDENRTQSFNGINT
ncbi:hypothetical protein RJT34_01492 [Clitoria ternatea]|uniref:Uncharacterized protein n=1 Tax=Clitoria ternatea TaxID=43366 RepID=A0AAN9KJE4_CLITE